MKQAWSVVLLYTCLAGCAWPVEPPDVERQASIWRWQAAAQDAANDAALARLHGQLARERPAQDAAEQSQAERYGVAVSAQQAALARLRPDMLACLTQDVRALARASAAPANVVADAVLAACRKQIDAVARTVELARISSAGLAADMAARLRPGVIRAVVSERLQPRPPAPAPDGGTGR
jgi:hypothetical protein